MKPQMELRDCQGVSSRGSELRGAETMGKTSNIVSVHRELVFPDPCVSLGQELLVCFWSTARLRAVFAQPDSFSSDLVVSCSVDPVWFCKGRQRK